MLSWRWHLQRMCFCWEMPVSSPSVWTVAFGARILQNCRFFSELALRKPISAGCLPHCCYGRIVPLDSCFSLLLSLNTERDGWPVFSQTCKYWSLWREFSLGWERENSDSWPYHSLWILLERRGFHLPCVQLSLSITSKAQISSQIHCPCCS